MEALGALCEAVEPPKDQLAHIHYFCGNSEIADDLKEHEPQRVAMYKATVALIRAYANIADELDRAGYNDLEIAGIKRDLDRYTKLREIVRLAARETLDLKSYEADMRHLLDTYIDAHVPRKISPFDNMPLLELIVKSGIVAAVAEMPDAVKASEEAVAETIENNVRAKIIQEDLNDPAYYAEMSALLDEIIKTRKAKAIDYEAYLKQIAALAKRVEQPTYPGVPVTLDTPGKRALYNNLGKNEELALTIDATVLKIRQNQWRDNAAKENDIKRALLPILGGDESEVERIFQIIKQHREY